MPRESYALTWTVGHSDGPDEKPRKRVSASVPGAVQLDWGRAEGYGDYVYARNYLAYGWMEDRYWTYSAMLEPPALAPGQRLFFVCKGVDYRFVVRLDGKELHAQEGMFTPFEIDLTEIAAPGSELEIVVFPAPKRPGAPVGREQADQSCKPAVSYGWDWHPRLIPLGIWDEAYLEVRSSSSFKYAEAKSKLNDSFDEGIVQLEAEWTAEDGMLVWTVFDRHGRQLFERTAEIGYAGSTAIPLTARVERPELWWPNGHGEPALYTSVVSLLARSGEETDRYVSKFGFRTVRLVMHDGAWEEPTQFPKSRSNPPITLEINGRKLFAKGTNWVNPDIFPGTLTREKYAPLIKLAAEANMNLLRVWGGGIVNKDAFFDLCDEAGLMVWQEFPLACNHYEGTEAYLNVLDRESRSIIRRLRSRASVVIWCGGNELFNAWSGMTDQSLALRLLNRNCYDLNPETPFLMTSPVMGMGHGNYTFRYPSGEDVFQAMHRAECTAYTEFGVPSPANAELLRAFIPPDELFPPKPGGAWEAHHAYGAWEGDTWLCEDTIEGYFGPSDSLEQLVERGQLLQSEGYKCIYEEARRQKPKCSMALNWCFNEPWPAAANNSIVCWPCEPKPALAAIGQACRPVLASAGIPKFEWREGEWFEPRLWMLSDSPQRVAAGRMRACLRLGERTYELLTWDFPELPPNGNAPGPTVRFRLPGAPSAERMVLLLSVDGQPEWNSGYTLLYRPFERSLDNQP